MANKTENGEGCSSIEILMITGNVANKQENGQGCSNITRFFRVWGGFAWKFCSRARSVFVFFFSEPRSTLELIPKAKWTSRISLLSEIHEQLALGFYRHLKLMKRWWTVLNFYFCSLTRAIKLRKNSQRADAHHPTIVMKSKIRTARGVLLCVNNFAPCVFIR